MSRAKKPVLSVGNDDHPVRVDRELVAEPLSVELGVRNDERAGLMNSPVNGILEARALVCRHDMRRDHDGNTGQAEQDEVR